jgi:hypothetical protein
LELKDLGKFSRIENIKYVDFVPGIFIIKWDFLLKIFAFN